MPEKNGEDIELHGNLVLPNEILYDSWVLVRNGIIRGIFNESPGLMCSKVVDCKDKYIFPGIIDDHVHSFSNPDEGFEGSTASAALGGVTTIIEMPYDSPVPVTDAPSFERKIELIRKHATVDVALLATLKKKATPEDIGPLVEKGACGFKLSLFETDVNRFPRIEDSVLWDILPGLAKIHMVVGFHAENDTIIEHLIGQYRKNNKAYPLAHVETRPPITETLSVLKLLELAYWTKVPLHIYHISHPRSVELIRLFRKEGVNVTGETCPHYLIFDSNDMEKFGAQLKINPCLRTKEEVKQMWSCVLDGDIDIVASDHAPWPLTKKQSINIFENSSGCPGVQFLFPLMYNEIVVKRKRCPTTIAKILSYNPAKRFNIGHRKGGIEIGKDADFAIVDPSQEWTIYGKDQKSVAKWSPYDGMRVTGKVVRTIIRGKTVFELSEGLKDNNSGIFIQAQNNIQLNYANIGL